MAFGPCFSGPEHAAIHNDSYFTASYILNALASGGVHQLAFVTGDKEVHGVPAFAMGADAISGIYEGPTDLVTGTEIIPVNNKRSGTLQTPQSRLYEVSSVGSDLGELISEHYVPGGSKVSSAGGGTSTQREEIVFAPNTEYILQISNESNTEAIAEAVIAFYETNKYFYNP